MRTLRIINTILAIALFLAILLSSCAPAPAASPTPQPATATPEPVSGPRLRIRNAGERDLKNLVVLFPDSRIVFGDAPAGTTSEYQPAPNGVYNYAAYEYEVDGEVMMQPVIDWVGESPRPGQSYTYVLEFDPTSTTMMAVQLVEVLADTNE